MIHIFVKLDLFIILLSFKCYNLWCFFFQFFEIFILLILKVYWEFLINLCVVNHFKSFLKILLFCSKENLVALWNFHFLCYFFEVTIIKFYIFVRHRSDIPFQTRFWFFLYEQLLDFNCKFSKFYGWSYGFSNHYLLFYENFLWLIEYIRSEGS